MKIEILTLFPKMFDGFLSESIIKRAINDKKVEINIHDLRSYSKLANHSVDDYPYGGGKGMVLMCEPVFDAIADLKNDKTKVIMMTPAGSVYKQKIAYELATEEHLIIICGHYEGFDERIRTIVDLELSIGDYVLTGGEIPSMVIMDSVIRLIDGVIEEESHLKESFNDDLLDYPNYTKPQNFRGLEVPEVLLSGHHQNIDKWRKEQRALKTSLIRPDLLKKD